MKKKYDIKTTDVETLKKWYHLMTLGLLWMKKHRHTCYNLWVGLIMLLTRGMMVFSLPSVRYSLWAKTSCFLTTAIC